MRGRFEDERGFTANPYGGVLTGRTAVGSDLFLFSLYSLFHHLPLLISLFLPLSTSLCERPPHSHTPPTPGRVSLPDEDGSRGPRSGLHPTCLPWHKVERSLVVGSARWNDLGIGRSCSRVMAALEVLTMTMFMVWFRRLGICSPVHAVERWQHRLFGLCGRAFVSCG